MKKNLLLLLLSLLSLPTLAQYTIYVSENVSGTGDGTSWANSYGKTQLQQAIHEAYQQAPAKVHVSQGVYKPNGNPSFYLADGVTIYGGFAPTGGPMNHRNPTKYPTVLSGEAGIDGDPADNLQHVIFCYNQTNLAVLDGFVITGGNAKAGSPAGGGLLINGGSPIIRNCLFVGNKAITGAAIGNYAYDSYNSSPTIINCTFTDNMASNGGGAILNYASTGNYAQPVFTNCTFYNNSALSGRAIYTYGLAGHSNPTLTNCILWNNGGASSISSEPGNTVTINYSLVEEGTVFTDGGHNIINQNPLFVNASANDLRITQCSPVINLGLSSANTLLYDLANEDRVQGTAIDLGAHETAPFEAPELTYEDEMNVTVTQNTPNVVLHAFNCPGELQWQKLNSFLTGTGPISVPTNLVTTIVYSAVCKVNGCTSPPSTSTITIVAPGGEPPVVSGNFDGYLDKVECSSIRGWAWDAGQPNTPITLEFFADGQSVGTVSAIIFRQDLQNAGKGNGQHAYSFTTPQSLKDGQNHVISAKVLNTNYTLKWGPKTLNCSNGSPDPGPGDPPVVDPPVVTGNFEGFLDKVECSSFRGWAWDAGQPNTPVSVEFFADGQSLGSVVADGFRQDIKDAGKGNGKHVYLFTTPVSVRDGLPHVISAKVLNSSYTLKWAPKTLTCPASTRLAAESEGSKKWNVVVLGNPVTGNEFDTEIQDAEGQSLRFQLTDLNGRLVAESQLDVNQARQQNRLRFTDQPAGLYLLRVASGYQVQTIKILKR
jgi:hypothetical protein